ncbi:MAG TPA: hypothetical protein ENJ00_02915 [Phycisphaerales bacterium]|nr:hypothetical protein [Phycisphaerales bacterium]
MDHHDPDQIMRRFGPPMAELAEFPTDALIERFAIGVQRLDPRAYELDEAMLDTAFRKEAEVGVWPVRMLIGHLADSEIFSTLRLRKTVAEEAPMLEGWDPDAYIDAGLYALRPPAGDGDSPKASIGASTATIHTLRSWTRDWLRTLEPKAWDRRAMHVERGEFTVKRLLALSTWHLEHHAVFLHRKINLLLGSQP